MDINSDQSSIQSSIIEESPIIYQYNIVGYKEYKEYLKNIEETKAIYIFYTGTNSQTSGYSWCPLSAEVYKVLEKRISELSDCIFLIVHVGSQDEWEECTNPFRTDKELNLKILPTVLKYKTSKRLEGIYCLKPELLNLVFEEDCEF